MIGDTRISIRSGLDDLEFAPGDRKEGHVGFLARCLCLLCYASPERNINDFVNVNLLLTAAGMVLDVFSTWLAPDDGFPRVKEVTSIINDLIGVISIVAIRIVVFDADGLLERRGVRRAKNLAALVFCVFFMELAFDVYFMLEPEPDELSGKGRVVRWVDCVTDLLWVWTFASAYLLFDWALNAHDFEEEDSLRMAAAAAATP